MTAIARKHVKVYIVAAGTNPSALAATDVVTGEIQSYNKSGGADEPESVPVFGGYVDKEKPANQVEIKFDIIPSFESANRWDALIYGLTGSLYGYNATAGNKAIFIEAKQGTAATDKVKIFGWNNCNAVTWDLDHSADDAQTGTFTFKLSPLDSSGISNFMTGTIAGTASITSLAAWSTMTS